jgi:hypothetical protein
MEKEVVIVYKNWRGVIGMRLIKPITIWYGKSEYHEEEQYFLKALDVDKNLERDFAMRDIDYWDLKNKED